MGKQTHYFYVLLCHDQSLYAGYTNNLEQRVATHNAGKGAKYTRPAYRRPVHLLYAETWQEKSQAMQQEYRFKQLSRSQKLVYLADHGVQDLTANASHIIIGDLEEKGDENETTEEFF